MHVFLRRSDVACFCRWNFTNRIRS